MKLAEYLQYDALGSGRVGCQKDVQASELLDIALSTCRTNESTN